MGLEFCSSNPVLRFGRLYLLNPTYSILGLRFTLLLVIYHLLDYMFGSLPVVLDLLLVSSRCCLNVITSVTTSDHGWKINCWNLQPSPMKRKENDLNQTSMITCKMLIELREELDNTISWYHILYIYDVILMMIVKLEESISSFIVAMNASESFTQTSRLPGLFHCANPLCCYRHYQTVTMFAVLSKNKWSLQICSFCAHARWWGHIIQLEGLVDYIVIWKYLEGSMNHHFSILQWFVQVDQNSEASFAAVHQEEPSWSRVAVHGIGFLSHLRLNSLSFIPFYLIYCLNLPCILYPYNSCIFMFLLKGIWFFFSTFNDVNVLWSFKVQCCLRREIKKGETWPTADFPARATIHHDWDVFHEPTRKFWFMSFVSTASVSVQWVFLSRRTEHKVSTSDKWRMFLKCFRLGREDLWMVCFEKDIYYIREDSS